MKIRKIIQEEVNDFDWVKDQGIYLDDLPYGHHHDNGYYFEYHNQDGRIYDWKFKIVDVMRQLKNVSGDVGYLILYESIHGEGSMTLDKLLRLMKQDVYKLFDKDGNKVNPDDIIIGYRGMSMNNESIDDDFGWADNIREPKVGDKFIHAGEGVYSRSVRERDKNHTHTITDIEDGWIIFKDRSGMKNSMSQSDFLDTHAKYIMKEEIDKDLNESDDLEWMDDIEPIPNEITDLDGMRFAIPEHPSRSYKHFGVISGWHHTYPVNGVEEYDGIRCYVVDFGDPIEGYDRVYVPVEDVLNRDAG